MKPDRVSAFFWSLFSVGAFVVALLLPLHILFFHFGPLLGLTEADPLTEGYLRSWLSSPVVQIYILVLVGGALFHAAHRLKYVLFDLGLRKVYKQVGYGLYTLAILGTLGAASLLLPLVLAIVQEVLDRLPLPF